MMDTARNTEQLPKTGTDRSAARAKQKEAREKQEQE